MTVNILGTPYEIIVKKYDEDETFAKRHSAEYKRLAEDAVKSAINNI